MADDPSLWTQASPTLEELRWILQLAYEHLRNFGKEMTATELRVALRRPTSGTARDP